MTTAARAAVTAALLAGAQRAGAQPANAQPITTAGRPAQLDVRAAGPHSVRVTLRPVGVADSLVTSPALAERAWPAPALSVRALAGPVARTVGALRVEVRPDPLTVVVTRAGGARVQTLR